MSTTYNQNRSCNCGSNYTTASNRSGNSNCDKEQKHVHELLGSTRIKEASCNTDAHNHRFALITGEAERTYDGCSHVHPVEITTDFYDNHYHEFCGYTEEAIEVGCGRHVHFIKDTVEEENGHVHEFIAATLIENPIEEYSK